MPIAFFAGQHGFLIFAPYLMVVLATIHLVKQYEAKQKARDVAPVLSGLSA